MDGTPEIGSAAYFKAEKARRRNADDSKPEIIESDFLSDYFRVVPESAFPEIVADDHNRLRTPSLLVLFTERPACNRINAQDGEKIL